MSKDNPFAWNETIQQMTEDNILLPENPSLPILIKDIECPRCKEKHLSRLNRSAGVDEENGLAYFHSNCYCPSCHHRFNLSVEFRCLITEVKYH